MAKYRTDAIGAADLTEYLEGTSDFSFELQVLKLLTQWGYQCVHGGFYFDPVTGKPRQFDIRAHGCREMLQVFCAVECKRLVKSNPLLISCVPRRVNESHHDVLFSFRGARSVSNTGSTVFGEGSTAFPVTPSKVYRVDEPVGKDCVQVGRLEKGELSSQGSDAFDKWSQALASANDLLIEARQFGERHNGFFLLAVVPVVVVPDGTLWQVNYNADGTRNGDPFPTNRCSFLVTRYSDSVPIATITHLEFVTPDGLRRLLDVVMQQQGAWFTKEAEQWAEPQVNERRDLPRH